MKPLTIISAAWFVLLCCLFVFSTPLAEVLWLGSLPNAATHDIDNVVDIMRGTG